MLILPFARRGFGTCIEASASDQLCRRRSFLCAAKSACGKFLVPQTCTSLYEPDGALLLLGESKCCWKLLEAFETFDGHETDDGFPLVPVMTADKAQRRIKSRKSAWGLSIAPNSGLIRKTRLGASRSVNDPCTQGTRTLSNRQSTQRLHRHTTPKTHGRTAWHI